MKFLTKAFGFLIKLLGKKAAKEDLIVQITAALDTNGDKKLTLDDWAKGKWKDIHWFKFIFALLVLAGSLWFGYIALDEFLDYLINVNQFGG